MNEMDASIKTHLNSMKRNIKVEINEMEDNRRSSMTQMDAKRMAEVNEMKMDIHRMILNCRQKLSEPFNAWEKGEEDEEDEGSFEEEETQHINIENRYLK